MSDESIQLNLMKLLASKHFPFEPGQRRTVKLVQLHGALKKAFSSEASADALFEQLCNLKGRGLVNTTPKIIMKDEAETAEFQIWLTPLGRTELQKKLTA